MRESRIVFCFVGDKKKKGMPTSILHEGLPANHIASISVWDSPPYVRSAWSSSATDTARDVLTSPAALDGDKRCLRIPIFRACQTRVGKHGTGAERGGHRYCFYKSWSRSKDDHGRRCSVCLLCQDKPSGDSASRQISRVLRVV